MSTREARLRARKELLSRRKEASAARRAAGVTRYQYAEHRSKAKRDGERLLKTIPEDTRDLTARLMGDPLPGRRAIDKMADS